MSRNKICKLHKLQISAIWSEGCSYSEALAPTKIVTEFTVHGLCVHQIDRSSTRTNFEHGRQGQHLRLKPLEEFRLRATADFGWFRCGLRRLHLAQVLNYCFLLLLLLLKNRLLYSRRIQHIYAHCGINTAVRMRAWRCPRLTS